MTNDHNEKNHFYLQGQTERGREGKEEEEEKKEYMRIFKRKHFCDTRCDFLNLQRNFCRPPPKNKK
jgi:hypothetical protein